MSDPNVTRNAVLSLLQRLGEGDADNIAALFSADIDWYVGGNTKLPWTGRRSRREEAADYFRTMWPHFAPGHSSTELDKIVVEGDDAVVFATFHHTAASTGIPFTTPIALHVVVDGDQITTLHLYEDTWAVSEAFFPVDS